MNIDCLELMKREMESLGVPMLLIAGEEAGDSPGAQACADPYTRAVARASDSPGARADMEAGAGTDTQAEAQAGDSPGVEVDKEAGANPYTQADARAGDSHDAQTDKGVGAEPHTQAEAQAEMGEGAEPHDASRRMAAVVISGSLVFDPYPRILEVVRQSPEPDRLFFVTDELGCQYMAGEFPEQSAMEYGYRYMVLGPVLFEAISLEQPALDEILGSASQETRLSLQEFFNQIPIFPSLDLLRSILYPLLSLLWGGEFSVSMAYIEDSFLRTQVRENYGFPSEEEPVLKLIEERYRAEAELLEAVERGNIEEALSRLHSFLQYRILPRTADPIRNSKNLHFVTNTLLRKAVQRARVHPYHIDNISRRFAIEIEAASSLRQLELLSRTMVRQYCMLVNKYSRKGYSALVQFALDYIENHYSEELSLDRIASLSNVSNGYLSKLFKRETGQTITEAINRTRIRQADALLGMTGLSVSEVAYRCGFPDANYFARVFRRQHGMSPVEFRRKAGDQEIVN